MRELVQWGVTPDVARRAPDLLHFRRRASAPDQQILMSFLQSGHDQDLAHAILEEEQKEIEDMTAALSEMGIEHDIAARAANTMSTAFESFRTGCALPASAGLEYCRDMAILLQALLTQNAQIRKLTSGLSWYDLHTNRESGPILASRRQAVLTRGHATTPNTSHLHSSPSDGKGRLKPYRKAPSLINDPTDDTHMHRQTTKKPQV